MNSGRPLESRRCVVRLAASEDGSQALTDYLQREGLSDAVRFAPQDDDELDVELSAGRFGRVVFADLDSLLTAVWNNHANLDRWAAAGVRIDLAVSPTGNDSDWRTIVMGAYDSLARHRRRRRRAQVIAAVILSVLAILAVAALLWIIPPAK